MTATAQRTLTLSCVILTMGNRPAEVIRAIDSVLAQHGTPVELVVVGNQLVAVEARSRFLLLERLDVLHQLNDSVALSFEINEK